MSLKSTVVIIGSILSGIGLSLESYCTSYSAHYLKRLVNLYKLFHQTNRLNRCLPLHAKYLSRPTICSGELYKVHKLYNFIIQNAERLNKWIEGYYYLLYSFLLSLWCSNQNGIKRYSTDYPQVKGAYPFTTSTFQPPQDIVVRRCVNAS